MFLLSSNDYSDIEKHDIGVCEKQTAKLNIMFALANLYLADRKSWRLIQCALRTKKMTYFCVFSFRDGCAFLYLRALKKCLLCHRICTRIQNICKEIIKLDLHRSCEKIQQQNDHNRKGQFSVSCKCGLPCNIPLTVVIRIDKIRCLYGWSDKKNWFMFPTSEIAKSTISILSAFSFCQFAFCTNL